METTTCEGCRATIYLAKDSVTGQLMAVDIMARTDLGDIRLDKKAGTAETLPASLATRLRVAGTKLYHNHGISCHRPLWKRFAKSAGAR
jgi:hypothetical protein